MSTSPVVAGVLTKIEKLLDVDMPRLQVSADGALSFAALIHRDGRIVGNLEKWNNALRFAVCSSNVRTQTADAAPIVAEAASIFGKQGIVLDGLKDTVQIIGDGCKEARRELRTKRAGVEKRRRGTHKVEGGEKLVEVDCSDVAVDLPHRQTHRDAHEKCLWQARSALRPCAENSDRKVSAVRETESSRRVLA